MIKDGCEDAFVECRGNHVTVHNMVNTSPLAGYILGYLNFLKKEKLSVIREVEICLGIKRGDYGIIELF